MHVDYEECYISVDVETAGPDPHKYALLSIGACLVSDPEQSFYIELKPTTMNATQEALSISGLSLDALAEIGLSPKDAMQRFDDWLEKAGCPMKPPVFVAFNAAFDWMFINTYFHRYLGRNPFGHAALDMKAFFMGLTGSLWSETAMRQVASRMGCEFELSHNALQDARDQAKLFRKMLPGAEAFQESNTRKGETQEEA
ncbi:MAG: 3'-5' exonuclease [Anaerolineales bacterium]|jgi:DNA polymerase III epsilon subunit-like protein